MRFGMSTASPTRPPRGAGAHGIDHACLQHSMRWGAASRSASLEAVAPSCITRLDALCVRPLWSPLLQVSTGERTRALNARRTILFGWPDSPVFQAFGQGD